MLFLHLQFGNIMITKKSKRLKQLKHQQSRQRAEMKKRGDNYRKRRAYRLYLRRNRLTTRREVANKPYTPVVAPECFSFIDNTEASLKYLEECRLLLHKNENINCDISKVKTLTPDAIALLVACTNDLKFRGNYANIKGNAPEDKFANKLFVESGFYKFVNTSKEMKCAQRKECNLLHKESDFSVQSGIAKEACLYGTRHVFQNSKPISELYEMLVEAMSNTNNHAGKDSEHKIKWWLYTYNDPFGFTSYSFIDLGVGIFESIPVQKFKKLTKLLNITNNVDLVQDLLNGKIKSSIKADNEIRGKGIPQIALNSLEPIFKRAFIISNDVKIDLKTQQAEKLSIDFRGTFLYWELYNEQKKEI